MDLFKRGQGLFIVAVGGTFIHSRTVPKKFSYAPQQSRVNGGDRQPFQLPDAFFWTCVQALRLSEDTLPYTVLKRST